MDATYNFSLGFAQGRESITEMPNRLFNQQALQRISTGVSLVSLSLGFSIFGVLIIVNQHQADLNDRSGGGSLATLGGIGAILVGTAFLVAACLHWRWCADPARKSARAVHTPIAIGVDLQADRRESAGSEIRPYLSDPWWKGPPR
jgi:hypothetical protein